MFGFLKKKIRESIDNVKKVFKEDEEKIIEKPGEELELLKKETIAEKEIIQAEEEKIEQELKELKEELLDAPEEERIEIESLMQKDEKELENLKEKEQIVSESLKLEEEAEKEIQEVKEEESLEKEESLVPISEEIKITEDFVEVAPETQETMEEEPKRSIISKIFKRKKEIKRPEIKHVKKTEEERGFVRKISAAILDKKLSEEEYERFFRDFEISMLESNIAYEVIHLLKDKLKKELVESPVRRGKIDEVISKTISDTFRQILIEQNPNEIIEKINENKKEGIPTKFLFLGVNGVGKTTSLAKICKWLQNKKFSVVLAASDTFRAASMEQLEIHAETLGVRVIKHRYGADPAAVAFDAIEHAKANKIDCVLIDSAGRQHTNQNLMDELSKLKRISKPDFTIFVADALTGNDATEQAREFGKLGFDSVILGKADVDQKGGAILSVSYVSGKPILFLGMGQGYDDLEAFEKEKVLNKIFN